MLLNKIKASTQAIEELENLVKNAKQLYLNYYFLNIKSDGVKLRKQLTGIEAHCKRMKQDSLDTRDARSSINFTMSSRSKQIAKRKIEKLMNDSDIQSNKS